MEQIDDEYPFINHVTDAAWRICPRCKGVMPGCKELILKPGIMKVDFFRVRVARLVPTHHGKLSHYMWFTDLYVACSNCRYVLPAQ